jgi:hypothetical protein
MIQQLWNLSLSMTAAFGAAKDLEVLSGAKDFWQKVKRNEMALTSELIQGIPFAQGLTQASMKEKVRAHMCEDYHILNNDDLHATLNSLLLGSKTVSLFNERNRIIAAMPLSERARMLQEMRGAPDFTSYEIVIQYDLTLPPAGILGFDLASYVSLCRLGAYMGFISDEEVLKRLDQSSSMARQHFSSFEQFALSSAVGMLFSNNGANYAGVFNNYYLSLHHPCSYWSNLKWGMSEVL